MLAAARMVINQEQFFLLVLPSEGPSKTRPAETKPADASLALDPSSLKSLADPDPANADPGEQPEQASC